MSNGSGRGRGGRHSEGEDVFDFGEVMDSVHAAWNVRWKVSPTFPSPRVWEKEKAMKQRDATAVEVLSVRGIGRTTIRQGGMSAGHGLSKLAGRIFSIARTSSTSSDSGRIQTCSRRSMLATASYPGLSVSLSRTTTLRNGYLSTHSFRGAMKISGRFTSISWLSTSYVAPTTTAL